MSLQFKNVIIIGAGGHLGPSILSAFTSDSHFNISVLSRSSSASVFPAGVTVHRVSDTYPEAELLKAFKGQDVIISTIATAQVGTQKTIIDAAIKAGVKRFVPSEFGSDTLNEPAMKILPQFFEGKRETVDYLKSKQNEGLTWTAFVTGPFLELAIQAFMGFDLAAHKAVIYNDGKDKWSATRISAIGLAVKNSLLHPAETANKYIYISSFTISQNEVLASLEKATGGAKWDIDYVDGDEQKRIGLEKMSKGDFSGAMLLIRYINSVTGHGGNFAEYNETSNELLGLPEQNQDLDGVIAGIVKG